MSLQENNEFSEKKTASFPPKNSGNCALHGSFVWICGLWIVRTYMIPNQVVDCRLYFYPVSFLFLPHTLTLVTHKYIRRMANGKESKAAANFLAETRLTDYNWGGNVVRTQLHSEH